MIEIGSAGVVRAGPEAGRVGPWLVPGVARVGCQPSRRQDLAIRALPIGHNEAMSVVHVRAERELSVPLPADVQDVLHLQAGDLVRFDISPGGVVRLLPVPADEAGFWTEEWQAGEREADEQLAAGQGTFFESAEEMFADMENMENMEK